MSKPGLHPGQELLQRDRDVRIVLGRSALGGGGVLTSSSTFRRVPEQILDHGGDGFGSRSLQEGFAAARAADPRLTPERYLAGLDPSTPLGRLRDALFGGASSTLLYTTDLALYERALHDVHRLLRRETPSPYDAGPSYGSHRYLDGSHIDLRDSRLLVLPINTPRFDTDSGQWLYPDYSSQARPAANRFVMAVQLGRVLGRDIPLDKQGRELFEALAITDSVDTYPCYLDSELDQSLLQAALVLSTGYNPMYRSAIKPPGPKPPGPRNAEQAQWQLAARLGPELLDRRVDLQAAWDAVPKRGRDQRPRVFIPHDAFSQLSVDELFAIALRRRDAPRVVLHTFEWEHHRSQRFADKMLKIIARLKLGPVWSSRFSMLMGLCEPENLHLVSPPMHAALDFYAGNFAFPKTPTRVDGRLKAEAFRPNPGRTSRWGNMLGGNPELNRAMLAEELEYYDLTPAQRDKALDGLMVHVVETHPDLARGQDVLVAYEPRHVIALLAELQHDDVQRAARTLRGADRASWNDLTDQLNRAADAHGIPPAFRLPGLK
jgi:hypothetical protein